MSFVERTCSCCGGENPEKTRIDAILAKYEGVKGALIPILQEVQSLYNYLPKDGRNIIRVCQGTACHVRGGKTILQALEKELDIKAGHTTDDLRFTLETVACIGACGLAPVMQVNEDTHGRLTPDKLKAILAKYQ